MARFRVKRKLGKRKLRRRKTTSSLVMVPRKQMPGFKGHPFGKQFYTKLRYNEAHTFGASSTVNFASNYKYCLNSLYDPNVSGVGHQPMGFDTLMSIYEKYTVVAAKITVCFIGDTTVPSVCGLRLVDGNETAVADKKVAIENGDSSWKYMTTANGGSNKIILSRSVNCKKFFGQKGIVGDDKYTLASNQTPLDDDKIIAELWVAPISASDQHGRTLVDVSIEYTAVFSEPKELPLS